MNYFSKYFPLLFVVLIVPADAFGKVFKITPVKLPEQELVDFQGQLRLVAFGDCEVYVSALPETDEQQLATFEVGIVNLSPSDVILDAESATAQTSRGATLSVMGTEGIIQYAREERERHETYLERQKNLALSQADSTPTLDEIVGNSRATSRRDQLREIEAPLDSPERLQRKYEVEEAVRQQLIVARKAEEQKKILAYRYYVNKMTVISDEARNGLISVQLPTKKNYKWIELHFVINGQDYTFRFIVS